MKQETTNNTTKITDDTRNIKKDSIFLVTPQNEKFIQSLRFDIKKIQREDLKKYFSTNIDIIGITGTNGKTTTAAAIYSALLDMGHKVALLGTRGMFVNDKQIKPKGLTTPSLLELYADIDYACKAGCEFFVMEVSSHAIKQERIFGLEFKAKILTNITSDHLDYHKTWQDYADTKISFLKAQSCVKIINMDDKCAALLRFMPHTFGYGIDCKSNLFVDAYSLNNGIFAMLTLRLQNTLKSSKNDNSDFSKVSLDSKNFISESCELNSSLFGLFNLYNLLACILCVRIITQKSLDSICRVLENFGGVAGRMEIVNAKPLIIIDFAHTTDGMLQVFESFKNKKIFVVFGAGGNRDSSKREKMGECAANFANKIYITNDNPRGENPQKIAEEILNGVQKCNKKSIESTQIILDRQEAIKLAISDIMSEKNIESCVLLILGKGDESTQIFSDKTIHFSDKECTLNILKSYKK